ncbi:alpha/beta hydrolase [Labilibaculum euxinus]|uniref:alpha/beta hydrolase n=1 Tax=Labilibaculum euxinus TaxID=2686357 RepID=UPI001CDC6128|nr:alpha/beta hydrolase [Labilibaculum euxinus]MDQ1772065.1 alpha/beta hydrolase [Labilibaculum euxinus]
MESVLKLKRVGILMFLMLMVFGSSFSQSKVIELWNGKVPGAIHNDKFKQIVDTTASWVDKHSIINPYLDVYLAPKEKSNGTAVVICPGGAYVGMAVKHEGSQVAKWLNSLGVTAFVLKYRLPDDSIMKNKTVAPLQDGQRAIRIVRSHAKEWGINPQKIGIMGFSAGGHMASTLSTHYNEKVYESDDLTSARPDFSLLIYPVISMEKGITHWGSRVNLLGDNPTPEQVKHFSNELQVNSETPPAFMVHSLDDGAVPVQNSINYALALQKFKIPCELHLYQTGGHGYGMGNSTNTESTWTEACRKWLEMKGLLLSK